MDAGFSVKPYAMETRSPGKSMEELQVEISTFSERQRLMRSLTTFRILPRASISQSFTFGQLLLPLSRGQKEETQGDCILQELL